MTAQQLPYLVLTTVATVTGIRLKPARDRRQIGLNAPNYAGNAVVFASKRLQLWSEKSRAFGRADNIVLRISCLSVRAGRASPCFSGTVST